MPDTNSQINYYLALTIGPIYKTIQSAQKTRDLWAASFILSQYMKAILRKLEAGQYGICLSPDVTGLNNGQKNHGAGIWNDNCFYHLYSGKAEALKQELPTLLRQAKTEVMAHIALEGVNEPPALNMEQLAGLLDRHFYCTAVLHKRAPNETGQEKILIELGNLLSSSEMLDTTPPKYDDYVGKVLFRPGTVLGMYNDGFDQYDKVFTIYEKDGRKLRRMPSLLEIATREFKTTQAYERVMQTISNLSQAKAKKEGQPESSVSAELVMETSSGEAEEEAAILDLLKAEKDANENGIFKKYHKYVAIVQSDGDGIGKIVKGFEDEEVDKMKQFSAQLMAFSKAAVGEIAEYDGLPVYAGGDDLLFIAPLQNHKGETLFDLLKKIKDAFSRQGMLKGENATLSFGISIFYYKYPLGEALEEGRKQLFRVAKKLKYSHAENRELTHKADRPDREKNAVAFRILLHGGQAFGAVLRQDGDAWEKWNALLQDRNNADAAFLSGLVHRLERLEYLMEAACRDSTTEAFFDQHFNEARGAQKDFVLKVRALAEAIYNEYGTLHTEEWEHSTFYESQMPLGHEEKKMLNVKELATSQKALMRRRYCNNLLYSALRMIQFLKAEDHE